MVFLSQKVDGNRIFTDYWKVLVLIFSGMGNTVFFWAKKLMERRYLLITGKFLVWTFRWWGNTVFFWVKKLMERWYLMVTEKFLFWTFRWWEMRPFLQPKSWWKDYIYLVFLSFPRYSRTWEIWFFVQSMELQQAYCRWRYFEEIPVILFKTMTIINFLDNGLIKSLWLCQHDLIIANLGAYGVGKNSLRFIQNSLSQRQKIVKTGSPF